MRPLLSTLLALTLLALPLAAQNQDPTADLQRKVLDAVTAQKWDEAIDYLTQSDKLVPEASGTAYNFACVYSRKGELDKAVEWLDKSIQWGWGGSKGSIYVPGATNAQRIWHAEMTAQDADLENLRKDPRFATLLDRMKSLQKKCEAYAAKPALHVPEKLKDATELPLLVVLHDRGGDKDATLAAWKPLADELGYALVVPGAPFPLREDFAKGMTWIDDRTNFGQPNQLGEYTRALQSAVESVRKQRPLSKTQVILAGEGEGATLALAAAMQSSGLYKGLAALDPEVIPALVSAKVQTAKANGLRSELRFDPEFWKKRLDGKDPKPVLDTMKQPAEGWALPGSVVVLAAEARDAAARRKVLGDAVRVLASAAPAATTTPASSPK